MNLWFDLDNTLVCAMPGFFHEHPPTAILRPEDRQPTERRPVYYVYPRPYLTELLQELSGLPNVTLNLWTAGGARYADRLLKILGIHQYFAQVFDQEKCTVIEGRFFKDLDRIQEKTGLIFIDDRPDAILDRGLRVLAITPFTGQPDDEQLALLGRILMTEYTGEEAPLDWKKALCVRADPKWAKKRGWKWVYDWEGQRCLPLPGTPF